MDSNSIGGILIPPLSPYNIPMGNYHRTKAPKAEQLTGELKGDLATYEEVGLFQRSVNQKTAYRYRGVLLRYQHFLGENQPSLAASIEYLSSLRKHNFDPSTLRLYRAALAGFHQWRGEELKFKVKVPRTSPRFVPWEIIQRILELAAGKPHDDLILRLLSNAGLRRDEVANLKVGNVEGSKLRFRGKGGKERTVPMTADFQELVSDFSRGKLKEDSLVELGEKGIYMMVKRYGVKVGTPEITPHDLRRAFGTHPLNIAGNIRIVQEILGHSSVNTTQIYMAVTMNNLEEAIRKLNNSTGDGKKTESLPTGEGKGPSAESVPRDEALHKQKIRRLSRDMAEIISVPSPWDKDLWKELPVDFRPGKYYLTIGEVDITEDGHLKVQYHDMAAGLAEPHIVRVCIAT
jgi:integrase